MNLKAYIWASEGVPSKAVNSSKGIYLNVSIVITIVYVTVVRKISGYGNCVRTTPYTAKYPKGGILFFFFIVSVWW